MTKKVDVLDNGHFFVVAAKESGIFALQKFAVGQMITQGQGGGFSANFQGPARGFTRPFPALWQEPCK